MAEASLSSEMLARMRQLSGTDLRIDHSIFNDRASPLAVVKFTSGIGDHNPLWISQEHGATSPYGQPIAPPSFVIGCFSGVQFGWPGLGSFHSGSKLWFNAPVYWEDFVYSSCRYDGFEGPQRSTFAERTVIDQFTNRYTNQFGVEVARIAWNVFNFERGTVRRRPHQDLPTEPRHWNAAELDEIEAQILAEKVRGPEARMWDEVAVGDELDPLTKGPIGLTDEIAFVAGGGAPIPRLAANASALVQYSRHPAWGFRDPLTGAREPIYSVHYNERAAQAMGVPYAYDVGFQRQCWQVQLLTQWIGDGAWVKYAEAEYRSFVLLGDVVKLSAVVVAKAVDDDGEHTIEVRTSATNQRGLDVMPGRAVIALPTRGDSASPAARRARSVEPFEAVGWTPRTDA
ncbi:MAG: MaoC family dehydratase N-terminal domain-containing protein [Candidatus Dormiibacterota bacterium]